MGAQNQVIKPINGDPFIGMLETPVTSAPIVRASRERPFELGLLHCSESASQKISLCRAPPHRREQVAGFLSNLPAYRTGVSPLLRGVEIGLAHGYLLSGPFIKARPPPRLTATGRGRLLGRLVDTCFEPLLTEARPASLRSWALCARRSLRSWWAPCAPPSSCCCSLCACPSTAPCRSRG